MGEESGAPSQKTYFGRYCHFLMMTDPRTMAPGTFFGMTLPEAREVVSGSKEGDSKLANRIVRAAIHPDTNEAIPLPLRMSGFVTFGSIPVIGMLTLVGFRSNPALGTAFWQFTNQSHNALFNYANRNASDGAAFDPVQFGTAYVGAVGTSMGLGVGLNNILSRFVPAGGGGLLRGLIPFPAVVGGNVASVLLMRYSELAKGISVAPVGQEGSVTSQEAAKRALRDTIATRMVLPIPIIALPPVIHSEILCRVIPSAAIAGSKANIAGMAILTSLCFAFALPGAIALFPQTGEINVDELEPEARAKARELWGPDVSVLTYNKGI